MPDTDARPVRRAWRDALLLVAVSVVLVAGLVHYGSRLGSDEPSTGAAPGVTASNGSGATTASGPAPSSSDAAQLESAPSGGPAADKPSATCWDGRQARRLSLCGLPQGVAGLRYVFPSLATEGSRCHPSTTPATGYDTVLSWTCFDHAAGLPVTVTYEQVADVAQATRWFETAYVEGTQRYLPGPHGGRCVWFDGDSSPAKATGMYREFPYAVSVYAPTKASTKAAWAHLVEIRSSRTVRGTPAQS